MVIRGSGGDFTHEKPWVASPVHEFYDFLGGLCHPPEGPTEPVKQARGVELERQAVDR